MGNRHAPLAQLQPQMPSRSDASRQPPNPLGADHANVADSYEQASREAPPSFVDGGARALQRAIEDTHGSSAQSDAQRRQDQPWQQAPSDKSPRIYLRKDQQPANGASQQQPIDVSRFTNDKRMGAQDAPRRSTDYISMNQRIVQMNNFTGEDPSLAQIAGAVTSQASSSHSIIQKELRPNKLTNKGNSVFGNHNKIMMYHQAQQGNKDQVTKLNAHQIKSTGAPSGSKRGLLAMASYQKGKGVRDSV